MDNEFLAACSWKTHIGSVRVDALELEKEADSEDDQNVRIVIVPGNPGICAYYVR
jgi:hypothetical protein